MSNISNYISNKNNNIKKAKLKKTDGSINVEKYRLAASKLVQNII